MKDEFNEVEKVISITEEEWMISITQDSIQIIANLLLPFSDKGREYIIKEALEIATRLTPQKKIKKGKEV